MENAITFRFEANDLQDLVKDLDSSKGDRVWVTFYLELAEVNQGNGTTKLEAVMRAKAESYKGKNGTSNRQPAGVKSGCPVPPCTLVGDDEGCADLVQQIVSEHQRK